MASSDTELKDGLRLPVWMKSKPTKEYEHFPGSPPAPEDSFFYMRYPKTDILFGKPKIETELPQVLSDSVKGASAITDRDWSRHTKPCQDVIHGIAPASSVANFEAAKPKPTGSDEGFKEDACGNSIVKVATQMVSSRGFTVASPDDDEPLTESQRMKLMTRRGSKSLPTTPAQSPKARRKQTNRYFTSPFEQVEDPNSRSWLTMALLGFKKDLTASTNTLTEEDALEARLQSGSLAESVESLGPAPRRQPMMLPNDTTANSQTNPKTRGVRPKPSELRELNFWSPTSM